MKRPTPPFNVNPEMPVWEIIPPVDARPCTWHSRSNSDHSVPAAATATRRSGSTRTPCIRRVSISIPLSSIVLEPDTLWPPPRTAIGRPFARAKAIAAWMSATPMQRTITPGRRS